jgi:predicted ester cyclase
MSAKENKDVVVRMVEEAWNGHVPEALGEFMSPDYFNHMAVSGHQRCVEGAKHVQRWLDATFSEPRFDIEDIIADGDMVAIRGTANGTHAGEFFGNPPTGKSFSAEQVHWFRLSGGKVVEHWAVRDDLGQLQQLGLLPEPGAMR